MSDLVISVIFVILMQIQIQIQNYNAFNVF